jgi:hypothetical protein
MLQSRVLKVLSTAFDTISISLGKCLARYRAFCKVETKLDQPVSCHPPLNQDVLVNWGVLPAIVLCALTPPLLMVLWMMQPAPPTIVLHVCVIVASLVVCGLALTTDKAKPLRRGLWLVPSAVALCAWFVGNADSSVPAHRTFAGVAFLVAYVPIFVVLLLSLTAPVLGAFCAAIHHLGRGFELNDESANELIQVSRTQPHLRAALINWLAQSPDQVLTTLEAHRIMRVAHPHKWISYHPVLLFGNAGHRADTMEERLRQQRAMMVDNDTIKHELSAHMVHSQLLQRTRNVAAPSLVRNRI